MKKKESTVIARAMYVQKTINQRPVGEKIESVVRDISQKLFLSDATIWKDYQKQIKGRNDY